MQEVQTDLQRQLQASKKDARDILEQYDRYKDDMADLSETVEIATLDKEMAEEKVSPIFTLLTMNIYNLSDFNVAALYSVDRVLNNVIFNFTYLIIMMFSLDPQNARTIAKSSHNNISVLYLLTL